MVSIGFFNTIVHKGNIFVFSVGGECFTSDAYVRTLSKYRIRTIVNTVEARGLSPNLKLIRAGLMEVDLSFMPDCYTPLPSQLKRWLDVLCHQMDHCRDRVRIAVHGIVNGPFLIALGLLELGLHSGDAQAMVTAAGGFLYMDHQHYLDSYVRQGISSYHLLWWRFKRGNRQKHFCIVN